MKVTQAQLWSIVERLIQTWLECEEADFRSYSFLVCLLSNRSAERIFSSQPNDCG